MWYKIVVLSRLEIVYASQSERSYNLLPCPTYQDNKKSTLSLTCHHSIIFSSLCQNFFFPFFVTLKISHSLFSLFSLRFLFLLFSNRSNIFHHFHAGQTKAETDWLFCPCSLFGSFLWATRFLQWGPTTRYVIWCLWLWMLDFVIVNPNKLMGRWVFINKFSWHVKIFWNSIDVQQI